MRRLMARRSICFSAHIFCKRRSFSSIACADPKSVKRDLLWGQKRPISTRTFESLPAVAPAAVAAPNPPCIVAAADSSVCIHVRAHVHQVNAIDAYTHVHVCVRSTCMCVCERTHSCTHGHGHGHAHIWQHVWLHSVSLYCCYHHHYYHNHY